VICPELAIWGLFCLFPDSMRREDIGIMPL